MSFELKQMLKKISCIDIIIGLIIATVCLVFFKVYINMLIVGIFMALVNFILNTVVSNYAIMKSGNTSLNLFSTIARIIITATLAIVICGNDKNKYIAVLVGYTFHYLAIIIYGLTAKENK